jgi:solute:Na+ symporter, SSS family
LRWIDLLIVALYLTGTILVGLRFSRRQTNTETYFVGGRRMPAWATGMSIMATLVSSVTFVAYPGSAYGGDWSLLVPGFFLILLLAVAAPVLIPFYRNTVGMSAYEYIGHRFGTPARAYASAAFALGHFGKMGFVYYLVALTANSVTGWQIDTLILVIGVVTVLYTLKGGIEAVIWTDVAQGFIMWVAILVCLAYLLWLPPGGPAALFATASAAGKFSLGSLDWDFSKPTIPVLVIYGFFWYLQKYSADQTLVQRYLVAPTDKAAVRGAVIGALQTVPLWALFMLIGTCTWAFYKLTATALPAHIAKADQVFPYFLTTQIPVGMSGLFLAALMAAAMSTLGSDLNCIAVVGAQDVYGVMRKNAADAEKLRAGKWTVALFGVLGMGMAEVLAHAGGGALELWFSVSAVLSGGLAGLFLLAYLVPRAKSHAAYAGIAASLLFTTWATVTSGKARLLDLGSWNYSWHELMIGAVAHVVLFAVGLAVASGSRK